MRSINPTWTHLDTVRWFCWRYVYHIQQAFGAQDVTHHPTKGKISCKFYFVSTCRTRWALLGGSSQLEVIRITPISKPSNRHLLNWDDPPSARKIGVTRNHKWPCDWVTVATITRIKGVLSPYLQLVLGPPCRWKIGHKTSSQLSPR